MPRYTPPDRFYPATKPRSKRFIPVYPDDKAAVVAVSRSKALRVDAARFEQELKQMERALDPLAE